MKPCTTEISEEKSLETQILRMVQTQKILVFSTQSTLDGFVVWRICLLSNDLRVYSDSSLCKASYVWSS
jgi:hypothetical protein